MTVYRLRQRDVFHTNRNCWKLQSGEKTIQEWDQEQAESWGHIECKYCSGQKEDNGGKNVSLELE